MLDRKHSRRRGRPCTLTAAGGRTRPQPGVGPGSSGGRLRRTRAVPPLWALKTLRGELPSSLADFFRSGVDRGLTGGEDGSGDPDDALFRA